MLHLNQLTVGLVPAGLGLTFLFNLTLLSFIVIPVAACVDLLVRRTSAATRHHVWLLAMIAVLAAPLLSLLRPGLNIGPSVAMAAPASELPLETVQAADSQSKQVNVEQGTPGAIQPVTPDATRMRPAARPGASAAFTPASIRRLEMITLSVCATVSELLRRRLCHIYVNLLDALAQCPQESVKSIAEYHLVETDSVRRDECQLPGVRAYAAYAVSLLAGQDHCASERTHRGYQLL